MVETVDVCEDPPSNFLEQFKGVDGAEPQAQVAEAAEAEFSSTLRPVPAGRAGEQALAGSFETPLCAECGRQDGPEGGGRYGGGHHEGLWYCGLCWTAWKDVEKANMMRPIYQQSSQDGNFFDQYEGGEGTDDVHVAWQPGEKAGARPGEMELPASWEKPVCSECGNEEGNEGGGRYRLDENGYKFFCGRCWKSWDVDAQRRMMQAWAPTCTAEPHCPPPAASADPIVDCPPPDAPQCDDVDWGEGQREDGDELVEEDGGPWDDDEAWEVGEGGSTEADVEAEILAEPSDFPPPLEPEAAPDGTPEVTLEAGQEPEQVRQQDSEHLAAQSGSSSAAYYSNGYYSRGSDAGYGNRYDATAWGYGSSWGNGYSSGSSWSNYRHGYGLGSAGDHRSSVHYGDGWYRGGTKSDYETGNTYAAKDATGEVGAWTPEN